MKLILVIESWCIFNGKNWTRCLDNKRLDCLTWLVSFTDSVPCIAKCIAMLQQSLLLPPLLNVQQVVNSLECRGKEPPTQSECWIFIDGVTSAGLVSLLFLLYPHINTTIIFGKVRKNKTWKFTSFPERALFCSFDWMDNFQLSSIKVIYWISST